MLTDEQLGELLRGTGVTRANHSPFEFSPEGRFYVALGIIVLPAIVVISLLTI